MIKKLIVFFAFFQAVVMSAQVATEADIPLNLDTDNDTILNIVDTDDDNDGVPDNMDAFPLDNTKSMADVSLVKVTAIADAGCRNNGANGGKNFGIEVSSDLNNFNRYQIIKFTMPAVSGITQATLIINTKTENDPLDVYFQADNSWLEGTFNGTASNGTTQGVTYTGNLTNYTNKQLLGTTGTPVGGKYTFNLPLSSLPSSGDFTLIILDPSNDGTVESVYTRETAGKADTVSFSYLSPISPRLAVSPLSNDTVFLTGGSFSVGFSLSQAPTANVYIPLELSNPNANIVGDKVLVFTPANWNVQQVKTFTAAKPGAFDIVIKPLHSSDTFYNGFNNDDLDNYFVQATNITNLGPWTATTGTVFSTTLNAVSGVGSSIFKFKITEGPIGMGIIENSGKISFLPLSNQVGTWPVKIEVADSQGNKSYFTSSISITSSGAADPAGIYVVPNGAAGGNGTAANPYNNIVTAINAAAGGGNVFIRGGEYDISSIISIDTQGTASNLIIIQPLPGESVKLNFNMMSLFSFNPRSKYITLKNIEIDGGTDNVDFWCLVSNAFWGDLTIPRGGGLAVTVEGEYITVEGNYIHNCYQKAIEIRGARYLKVYDNIIHSIATTSLSGGHGIMRQQKGAEIFTNDLPIFRWDINSNLVFNVEQRIYSWVPAKGFMDMVLDEGKPILIDDPKDTDGIQETMKANIENNVVAYGSIDHIRLKSTPNLTVKNNTVYSASPHADGITDKGGDTPTPQFTNTTLQNNAVQTMPGTFSFELGDIIAEGNTAPNVAPTISGNYRAIGSISPSGTSGVTYTSNDMFVDPDNGNFRIKSSLGLPSTLGVPAAVLDSIDARVAKFGVVVKWDGWDNDHLKLTQTILDNIPGVNDGVSGNESVFTNFGTLTLHTPPSISEILFNVVPGTAWKAATGAPATEKFELNPDYSNWYIDRNNTTKNTMGADYTRIRWGNSFTKQDQVFQNDWLTNCQITAADSCTIIYSDTNKFTLDGDILIDFEGYTPVVGNKWYLMEAAEMTSANSGGKLFDSIRFEGATLTPADFILSIETVNNKKVLQLLIIDANAPKISISGNAKPIVNGDLSADFSDSTNFGSTNSTITKKFAISNSGTDTLKINAINLSGTNASDFTISSFPAAVNTNDSSYFYIVFNAASNGVKTATVEVKSNDPLDSVYTFVIEATKTGGCAIQTTVLTDTMYNNANDSNAFNCLNWYSGLYPDSMVNIVIKSGAEITIKTNQLLKVNSITVQNGASLLMDGGQLWVYGNIHTETGGTINADSGALLFKGTMDNTITGEIPTFANIEINKPSGAVILDNSGLIVGNHIEFTHGLVQASGSSSLEILSSASSSEGNPQSYAACQVIKNNLTNFVFPTGKGSKWARLSVQNSPGGIWRCEYFDTPYTDTTTIAPLTQVSAKEYWDLEPDGPYTADVNLYWEDASWSGIELTQPSSDLVVAHYNGTDWESLGNSSVTFAAQGEVGTTSFSFSPFTFGSLSPLIPLYLQNPKLQAIRINASTVTCNWETNNNTASAQLLRKIDGEINYSSIFSTPNGQTINTFSDNNTATNSWYMLKTTDYTGATYISKPVYVGKQAMDPQVVLFPNPVQAGSVLNISIPECKNLYMYNLSGQLLYQLSPTNNAVLLPSNIGPGVYHVRAQTETDVWNSTLIIDSK